MGLFLSILRIARSPRIHHVTYGSSGATIRDKIKTDMRIKILTAIDKGFNYNHKALNEDGSLSLYIDVVTDIVCYTVHGSVVYKVSDIDHPELQEFYRSVLTDYVTKYNESDAYIPHRPNRNYRISLDNLWPPKYGYLQFILKISYNPSTANHVRSVLTSHVARQLVRGLPAGSTCPITYEPYTELPQLCVGFCGHVFSSVVASQTTCPLCRSPTGWATVERETLTA